RCPGQRARTAHRANRDRRAPPPPARPPFSRGRGTRLPAAARARAVTAERRPRHSAQAEPTSGWRLLSAEPRVIVPTRGFRFVPPLCNAGRVCETHRRQGLTRRRFGMSIQLDEFKTRQRAVWGSGQYGAVSVRISEVGERVVDRAEIQSGMTVLDVACGTG